ncbi:hypothetical protein Nepgr_013470 [Nepenthes gracilis]|uniref:Uncharacterized protein n=1 Tax=Nepenthes gracilis TaxID=150966 RepID=A0AAD3SJ97_NEPGR|nr:hypothetical protein Nepgr_013470 [Nepenthes gracilis]
MKVDIAKEPAISATSQQHIHQPREQNILASAGTKAKITVLRREYTSANRIQGKNLHSNEHTATSIFLNLLLNQLTQRSLQQQGDTNIRKPTSSSHFNPRKWSDRPCYISRRTSQPKCPGSRAFQTQQQPFIRTSIAERA